MIITVMMLMLFLIKVMPMMLKMAVLINICAD